jgi:hypothetical protein
MRIQLSVILVAAQINRLNRDGMQQLKAVLEQTPQDHPQRATLEDQHAEYLEISARQESSYRYYCDVEEEFWSVHRDPDSGIARHVNQRGAERKN